MPLNRREFLFRGVGFATVSAMVPRFPILGTRYLEESVAAGIFGSLGNEVFEEFTRWEEDRQPTLKYFGEHFAHGVGGIPIGILDRNELLRSEFKIEEKSIVSLSSLLAEMERIEGITVFKYGDYLTEAT